MKSAANCSLTCYQSCVGKLEGFAVVGPCRGSIYYRVFQEGVHFLVIYFSHVHTISQPSSEWSEVFVVVAWYLDCLGKGLTQWGNILRSFVDSSSWGSILFPILSIRRCIQRNKCFPICCTWLIASFNKASPIVYLFQKVNLIDLALAINYCWKKRQIEATWKANCLSA